MILDDLRRRFLLALTVLALVVVSGAIGVGLADWPFLQRSWRLAALLNGEVDAVTARFCFAKAKHRKTQGLQFLCSL